MDQVFLQDFILKQGHPVNLQKRKKVYSCSHLRVSCWPRRQPGAGSDGRNLIDTNQTQTSLAMTNHGDDCYFFYYSTCTKGDSCPFRHCEAAMGNETVCNLWQEGRCFRNVCKFRHMEITKKRKEIPCYWEKHPAGCQKPHCAFFHEKPRYVVGVVIPPDIGHSETEEQPHEEPPPLPATPLPTAANLQLRGVIKTESQEPVPSPTHPPVVINPADDDEDEDDQFSEEGDGVPSPRKRPKSDDSHKFGVSTLEEIRLRRALKASMNRAAVPAESADISVNSADDSHNFGVSSLEEIRLRRALKASMNRTAVPAESADVSVNGEKENTQAFQTTFNTSDDAKLVMEESLRPRGNVADRLGRLRPCVKSGGPLKYSLAMRLGRFVNEEEAHVPPQKAMRSIKERLTLPAGPVEGSQADESSTQSQSTTQQICIKTLEEIRLEKAAKSQSQKDCPPVNTEITVTKTVPKQSFKAAKRMIFVKEHTIDDGKNLSDALHSKKSKADQQNPNIKKFKQTAERAPGKCQEESDAAEPVSGATKAGEIRVKTLEEIRREKAARLQEDQVKSSDGEEKKHSLLPNNKLATQIEVKADKSVDVNKTSKVQVAPETLSKNNVKVKTFEEIMREKHLRKQEMAEQASTTQQASAPPETEPSPKPSASTLKRKILTKVCHSPPRTSPLDANDVPPTQNVLVRKLKTVKSKAFLNNTAVISVPISTSTPQNDAHAPSHSGSSNVQEKNTTSPSSAKQLTPERLQSPTPDKTHTKVRPKLNVKPSVMKPALQVHAGKKRKGAERSAVAAVKPLNSASIALDQPPQQTASLQVLSNSIEEAELRSPVSCCPSTLQSSSSEDLQSIPGVKHSPRQEPKLSTTESPLPQSSVLKTTPQSKSRRQSVAGSRYSTSAADDFEELINEFTDDHLEGDVDPGIGEDDLLQELSDMIDS
ncbi:zinc finger CCCH domain-containing protein 11A isoform X3 [Dunckerocampus dactyliophorus]|uniref:zinc finger CCCH domain-containing protein 11A isoform X3 n=1 Tax=Dunckerocampus dactyliophorus TaxID=161453 RepID=UPI0024069ED3|nr:zinc finger CCCH domain-containing protein 11A isoform X3 [Dunckerocampus dactyliophorus]